MATTIYTVAAGTSQIIPAPALSSVCVQPVSGGTALIQYGPDGVSPQFQSAPQGANGGVYSLNMSTYSGFYGGSYSPNSTGNIGKVQVTATTQLCQVLVSDLQQYPGSFPERQTVLQTGVAFTSLASSTAEQELVSVRFHPGYFKNNFRLEFHAGLTLTNNANVKTLKWYFGPSTNSATTNAVETSAAAMGSNVYTSMSGAYVTGTVYGRNDGQTTIGSNPGLLSAGGMGSSVTANVSGSSTNYSGSAAVEQVFIITGTKATGTDTFTLDSCLVKVYQ